MSEYVRVGAPYDYVPDDFGRFEAAELEEVYLKLIQYDLEASRKHYKRGTTINVDRFEDLDKRAPDELRGLWPLTWNHFNCGVIDDWVLTKSRAEFLCGTYVKKETGAPKHLPPPSRRFIIPTPSMKHFNAVAFPSVREHMKKEFWKQHAGEKELFFDKTLHKVDLVLVVEGEIDDMSIWQACVSEKSPRYAVVAILGCQNWRKTLLPNLKTILRKKKLLLLLDGDDGRKASDKLRKELLKLGVPAVSKFYYDAMSDEDKKFFGQKVDANDILRKRGEDFLRELTDKIVAEAQTEFVKVQQEIDAGSLFAEDSSSQSSGARKNRSASSTSETGASNSSSDENGPSPSRKSSTGRKKSKSTDDTSTTTDVPDAEITREDILPVLQFIPAKLLTRDEWFEVCTVLHRYGCTLEDFKEWSKDDKRYDPDACEIQWNSCKPVEELDGQGNSIGTLLYYADKYGGYLPSMFRPKKSKANAEDERITRLKKLQALPPSEERNEIMRELIRDLCEWRHDKNGNPTTLKPTVANMILIFKYDPCISNLVGYDQFQEMIVYKRQPDWKTEQEGSSVNKEWSDSDDNRLRIYLRTHYGELRDAQLISDYFDTYSIDHSFNQVKDYLNNLPKWDGQKRVEELFIKYLRVQDTPYARAVTRNWLIAAIARIFHPGCRYQTALVLQGNQRIGKTYIAELLGGPYYSELTDNVEDPHAIDAIRNTWICEIKEMAALGKAAVNAIKAFIDRSEENRRFAYLKRTRRVKRHCVFVITINDKQFLRDWTGNRRYMILECGSAEFDYVPLNPADIPQIWAEALVMYKELFRDGFDDAKLALPREIQVQAEEVASKFMMDDGTKAIIQSYLEKPILPAIIWKLLSKKERKEFIDNGQILAEQDNLEARRKARGGTEANVARDINEINRILNSNVGVQKKLILVKGLPPQDAYVLFGTVPREHVCASEIADEAFGVSDKRKAQYRINDILPTISGWTKGVGSRGRLQKTDREYNDQKNVFWRNETNSPTSPLFGDDPNDGNSPETKPPTETDSTPANDNGNSNASVASEPASEKQSSETNVATTVTPLVPDTAQPDEQKSEDPFDNLPTDDEVKATLKTLERSAADEDSQSEFLISADEILYFDEPPF